MLLPPRSIAYVRSCSGFITKSAFHQRPFLSIFNCMLCERTLICTSNGCDSVSDSDVTLCNETLQNAITTNFTCIYILVVLLIFSRHVLTDLPYFLFDLWVPWWILVHLSLILPPIVRNINLYCVEASFLTCEYVIDRPTDRGADQDWHSSWQYRVDTKQELGLVLL